MFANFIVISCLIISTIHFYVWIGYIAIILAEKNFTPTKIVWGKVFFYLIPIVSWYFFLKELSSL